MSTYVLSQGLSMSIDRVNVYEHRSLIDLYDRIFHVQLFPGIYIETIESTNRYGVDEGTESGWWLQNVDDNVTGNHKWSPRVSCQRSEM